LREDLLAAGQLHAADARAYGTAQLRLERGARALESDGVGVGDVVADDAEGI